MIEISNLTKIYNEGTSNSYLVLDGCNFRATSGETIVLTGDSGAGKTTFLKIIGLIDKQYKGNYILNGLDISTLTAKQAAEIRNGIFGFVFQDYRLLEEETVYANIAIPLLYSKKLKRKDRAIRIKNIADSLYISEYLGKDVNELSGGEQQRVAIARALVNDPDILILDEPTNALNNEMKLQVMNYIDQSIGQTRIMIIATHDEDIIERFPENRYILKDHCLNNI